MLSSARTSTRVGRFSLSGKFRRNRSLQFGTFVIGVYALISILDLIYPEYIGVRNAFNLFSFTNPGLETVALAFPTPPTLSHGIFYIFGTTAYEIPILPAILAALPVDLGFAVMVAGASAIIGIFVGVGATYISRKLEVAISSFANVFISFPLLISVMVFGLLLNFTLEALVIGMIAVLWSYYAQISRMLTLSVKENNYIEAARASGASRTRIIFSHIIPNILTPVMVRFSTDLATVVVIFSAVNFMFFHQFLPLAAVPELGGLMTGFPAFGYEYGYRFASGQIPLNPYTAETFLILGYWWTVLFPIIFLLLLIIGLMAFSDGLRKTLDPRTNY